MSSTTSIELTADPERKTKLERKLEEYAQRIQARAPRFSLDLTSKQYVLTELLVKGVVDVEAVRARAQDLPWYDAHAFDNAVAVVAAYNDEDTLGLLRGGTGLR